MSIEAAKSLVWNLWQRDKPKPGTFTGSVMTSFFRG